MPTSITPAIIAHRGAGTLAPENTLAAIRTALTIGVDGLECDIQCTADGEPILLHDTTLDRTTNGTGPAAAYSLDTLQKLDAGRWFNASFTDEPIPTLYEALRAINGGLTAFLEIKDPTIVDRTADIILAAQATAWCVVMSFSEEVLTHCARRLPETLRARVMYPAGDTPFDNDTVIKSLAAVPVHIVGLIPRLVTPELLERAHKADIRILTGPLDDERQIAEVFALGPDLALTNRPDIMLQYVRARDHH